MDGNWIASSVLHVVLHLVYINIIIAGGNNNISFCLYLFVYISTINQSNRVTICTGVTSQLIVTLTGLRDAMLNWTNADRFCHCALYTVSLCHCLLAMCACMSLCLYNPSIAFLTATVKSLRSTVNILSPEHEYPYEIINHGGFDRPNSGRTYLGTFPSPSPPYFILPTTTSTDTSSSNQWRLPDRYVDSSMDGEMEMEEWIGAEGWWNLLCCDDRQSTREKPLDHSIHTRART